MPNSESVKINSLPYRSTKRKGVFIFKHKIYIYILTSLSTVLYNTSDFPQKNYKAYKKGGKKAKEKKQSLEPDS